MNRKEMSKCTGKVSQSFPIGLGFTPTQEIYDSIQSAFSVEINWAQRTTLPIFSNQAKALIDESADTTARFQGTDYTLVSTQVTNATHNSWILNADAKSSNRLDFLCVFKSRIADTDFPFIFVVIPVISMDSASPESNYLLALAGLCSDKKTLSVEDVLPSGDKRVFASYTTCLEPNGDNALVLVFLNGRYTSLKTTNAIYEVAGRGPTTPWPSISVPTSISLTTPTSFTQTQFEKSVRISHLLTRQLKGGQFRADDTYAYTCVVMDPDKNVKDGKLLIDTNTGNPVPLDKVLAERERVRQFEIPVSGLKPGQLEFAIAIFLGSLLGLLIIILIIYAIGRFRPGVTEYIFPDWLKQMSGISITAILFAFIGFLIGIFIQF
jgi:hypothetical protein